jgi:Tfp pilus assembly PilM family ATPase
MVEVPFKRDTKGSKKKTILDPWKVELASDVKNALNDQNITTSALNLSLPTKDIIFRSFTIPFMDDQELKSAVEFEVSKYIPFGLEDLSFSFHPIHIEKNHKKLIRIIFVAIKNDALIDYFKILEAASLRVQRVEPASSSLIRVLSFKNLIPEDQTVALIEKDYVGRIIVIDNNIPQFVREFYLSKPVGDQGSSGPESNFKTLAKEIHISLDYFNRQNEHLSINKILLLTSSQEDDLTKNLEKHLNLPVDAIAYESILNNASPMGINILHAYGTSIAASVSSPTNFDFSTQKTEEPKKIQTFTKKPINYKLLIKIALVCVPLIIISFIVSSLITQKLKKDVVALNQKLGAFQDSDTSFIETKELGIAAKINNFKNIRTESNVTLLLMLIPDLLPDGAWLSSLDVTYDDPVTFKEAEPNLKSKNQPKNTGAMTATPTLIVTISGYAYSEDKNRQFRLVNELLRRLKSNDDLLSLFQSIDLETTRIEKLDEHDVTLFKIVCIQSRESNKKIK